jgi:O-antigen ligase
VYFWKVRSRPQAPWVWAVLVVALACVPLLPSGYTDRLATIFNVESDPTGSAQARWTDTKAALGLTVRNPIIGVGIGQNMLALNEERGISWVGVHNVYLEYAVELGLPGLILLLMLIAYSLQSTRFAQRQAAADRAPRDLFYLAEGVQISLLAFVVAALFHPGGYQFGFYYFAGLATATRVIAEAHE